VIPLYGFLHGDTIGLLVLAVPEETAAQIAEKLQAAAAVRVPHRSQMRVVHNGRMLDPLETLAAAGVEALDRIDVVPEGK
jgi:hypothetical protein